MKTIKKRFDNLIEINRSKFYGVVSPIESIEQAKDFVNQVKKDYPKATHYCYAYRINGYEKSNDDGEPSGTAGRPILEFLKNADLDNLICVVVRYFGGIKLGAGGLIRAYVDASKNVCNQSEIYQVIEQNLYEIKVNYSLYDIVKNYLISIDGSILDTLYEEYVTIIFSSNKLLIEELKNFTNGNIDIKLNGSEKVYVKI